MVLQHHILPAFGTRARADVASGDVIALHHKLPNTPYTANRTVWVLSKRLLRDNLLLGRLDDLRVARIERMAHAMEGRAQHRTRLA